MSRVEATFLKKSPHHGLEAQSEKVGVIVVKHFPEMGKLTALRFIEWVQANPGGVISLPTGKRPEHFIAWVKEILNRWEAPDIQDLLLEHGLKASEKPDMKSLHFVQIDDFYPMDGRQENSFYSYVKKFYIDGFGLDAAKALLIPTHLIGLEKGKP